MRILDELEKQDTLWSWFGGGPDYSVCTSDYGELVEKALPALIRVARAANSLQQAVLDESGQAIAAGELFMALKPLRDLSQDDLGSENGGDK